LACTGTLISWDVISPGRGQGKPLAKACDRLKIIKKTMYGIRLIVFHSIYHSLLESSARHNGSEMRFFSTIFFPTQNMPAGSSPLSRCEKEKKTSPPDILGIALCTCLSSCPFPSNCRELYLLQTRRIRRSSHRNCDVCHMSPDLTSRSCSSWNLAVSLSRRVAVCVNVVVVENFRVPIHC